MPNGEAINEELEFKEHIKKMADRELLEFTASTIFDMQTRCQTEDGRITELETHGARITTLETQSKKMFGITGGAGAIVGGLIIAGLNYLAARLHITF